MSQILVFPRRAPAALGGRSPAALGGRSPAEVGQSAVAIARTCAWLQQRGVRILGYGWHCFGGARVRAQDGHALRALLAGQRVSRGHTVSGGVRVEHWRARDPATQVLVDWDEERGGAT